MNESYTLNTLWKGADFKLVDLEDNDGNILSSATGKRYCFLGSDDRQNECLAAEINYDEPNVKINTIVSFPAFTEVIYCPRKNNESK